MDSLSEVNQTLKTMQGKQRVDRGSIGRSEEAQYFNERDNSYSFSSSEQPKRKNKNNETKKRYERNSVDGLDRSDLRQNKESASKLVWEIDDPDLYTLSDSDDEGR